MNLINQGSVKNVYSTDKEDEIEFEFTNRISVFDKMIPNFIPHKGETICKTATYWLKKAEDFGINTHYIESINNTRIRVKKVNVIRDYNKIKKQIKNYLIPIEFICRYYVAGFLYDRIRQGMIDYKNLGFKSMPSYGQKLNEPFFELSTKLEDYDRFITEKEALSISGLEKNHIEEIYNIIMKIDTEIKNRSDRGGLIHVDGKKEFAIDNEDKLMLVDVFGTADEERFWDKKKYDKGECIELSKEYVRQIYRKNGYKDKLYLARENGSKEPDIPPLSNEEINIISNVYKDLAERIIGGD